MFSVVPAQLAEALIRSAVKSLPVFHCCAVSIFYSFMIIGSIPGFLKLYIGVSNEVQLAELSQSGLENKYKPHLFSAF